MADTFDPVFPILVYREGLELPKEGTYFLVAGNGCWLHKDTGIVKAFVPVENISALPDFQAESYVQCRLPKLPAKLVWQIKSLFKKVVGAYGSEAATSLYFNKETGEFRVHVPQQQVSHGGVNYRRTGHSHEDGFLCVGTIHSHADFTAFHSGTDVHDEENFDGLHVTFGHNNRDEFSISATIAVNGFRTLVDPLLVLEGIEVAGEDRYKLTEVSEETRQEWSSVLDEWFGCIVLMSLYGRWNFWSSDDEEIRRGDKVSWVGDLSTVSFKTLCGEGPFEVDAVEDGHLTIRTRVGLARFNEKLFKKEPS